MKLYYYVVRYDSGFAPNPFGKYFTLACCKPKIRKNANVDDWVIGTGSKENGEESKLVYAIKITDKINFEQYAKERRFKYKIPSPGVINERGDNIYYKNKNGRWMQRASKYHDSEDKKDDLSVNCVLISQHYFYFGKNSISMPKKFRKLIGKGPGHRCNFDEKLVNSFLEWLEINHDKGRHGDPHDFKERMTSEERKYCGHSTY